MVEDLLHDRVVARELFEHLGVRRGPCLGALEHRQLQLAEQEISQLRRRVHIEAVAGQVLELLGDRGERQAQFFAVALELRPVHLHAVAFHPEQHLGERRLHLRVEFLHALLRE